MERFSPEGRFKEVSATSSKAESSEERSHDREAIEGLAEPGRRILSKLRKHIEKGEVGSIVGIDGSGRIPALILKEVISSRYQALGYEPLKTAFVRGKTTGPEDEFRTSPQSTEYLSAAIDRMHLDKNKMVLLVEDTVAMGEASTLIAKELMQKGYKVELCAFSLRHGKEVIKERLSRIHRIAEHEKGKDTELHKPTFVFGENKETQSSVSDHPHLSGITAKDGDVTNPHGSPYRGSKHAEAKNASDEEVQSSVNFARGVVKEVAENLLDQYKRSWW